MNKILINKDLHLCYKYNLVIDEIVDCFKNPKKYSKQIYNCYPNVFDDRIRSKKFWDKNYYKYLDLHGMLDIVMEGGLYDSNRKKENGMKFKLKCYTFGVLRRMCKENGLKGYRNKNKKQLIQLLIKL
tara:strand:- start:100 stop:483 length:384 start_codon:yes stop_codon:yes gene_type:complete